MKSRFIVNLFLLFCVIALISFYFYRQSSETQTTRLTQLNLSEIDSITIVRANNNDIILKKQATLSSDKPWQMIQPYSITAHQFRVNTLLAISQLELDTTYKPESLNLSDYALDPARATIMFNQTAVHFGKVNPVNGKRYLLSGNTLSLVLDKAYPLVSASAASLVDLSPMPANANITGIQLPHLKLMRDNSTWQSTPLNSLNADEINTLIQNWKNTSAFAVHAYTKRKQIENITLFIDNKPILFEASSQPPWLILARPDMDIEYHLDISFKKKLFGLHDA